MAGEAQEASTEGGSPKATRVPPPLGIPSTPTPTKRNSATGRRGTRNRGSAGSNGGNSPQSGGGGQAPSSPQEAVSPSGASDLQEGPESPKEDKAAAAKPRSDNAVTARLLKTKMCYFFERGKCASLDCRYAHNRNEMRVQPDLQKTKLCKTWQQHGVCSSGENCVFAHGEVELRVTTGIYKTQMCHFFERGRCLKGDRCNHAHGSQDLRQHPVDASQGASGPVANTLSHEGRSPTGADTSATRAPLSPLPLADLLADTGNTSTVGQTLWGAMPSPDPRAMGFHPSMPTSPMWSVPTPWTAPGAYGVMGSPVSPMHYQALSPGLPMMNTGGSPGWMPDHSGGVEGSGDMDHLDQRLANLDEIVRNLAADVREAWPQAPPQQGQQGQSPPRTLHRI